MQSSKYAVGAKVLRKAIIAVAGVLIFAGLIGAPALKASPGELSGGVLHVYSHDYSSYYVEVRRVNVDIREVGSYSIEQTVLASNYEGPPNVGVVLLEVKTGGSRGQFYSIYWYGEDSVYIYGGNNYEIVSLDMSRPHTYMINVTTRSVYVYIDGQQVASFRLKGKTVAEVHVGRSDASVTYDLYIDNVQEYLGGSLNATENFDDGKDDFYTNDQFSGSGDSGEEVITSIGVPEYPFLQPLLDFIYSMAERLLGWG